MKKVLRLSESDLVGLVTKILNEKKGGNTRQKHYKYDEEYKSIWLENGDQSDMDKILSELPEDIKFLAFRNCDGFADFSNINICELPEIIFVNLRGTKNNFEELFDCYEKMGNDMYDLAKPEPPYFKDDRISDVPEPRFSMNESVLNRLVKRIVNEDTKKEDPTVSFMWKIKKRLKGISDEQLDYNMRNDLPWDWKGTKEGFYEKMEPKGKNSGSN